MAPIDTGMNAKTAPPARNKGPARFAQKCPCAGTWVAHKVAAPSRIIPAAMTSLAEVVVTRICAGPASASAVTDAASHATPVFRAEYPSTCCMYRVPVKKKLKKLAPHRKPDRVRPGEGPQPEQAQRQQ